MRHRPSLKSIYLIALSTLFAFSFAGFLWLDVRMNRAQSEEMLLEEARTFAQEMDAVWGFMDNVQRTINYTSDGIYEFKGLHCAIVGKSVGTIFSHGSDYTIRYTNFNPRNILDKPDEYETAALTAFNESADVTEYYGFVEVDGERRFRYVQALAVDEGCLECHGEPAGEIDETGFAKEGWTLESVGGAISMVIPTDKQDAALMANITRDSVFFFVFTLSIGAVVYGVTWFFVFRPLARMERAFGELGDGRMGVELSVRATSSEMTHLIGRFNAMASELQTMYAGLEDQVEARTLDLHAANEILERQRDELGKLAEKLARESSYKSDLLSMVNHELRTPLASIITFAQVSKGVRSSSNDEHRLAWEEIEKNGNILLEMINNMLDVARADAGVVEAACEPVDLGDVVAAVRGVMEPIATKYKVTFEASVAPDVPLVMGDYDKLVRIFENLASNAIKFTSDGGHVLFAVRLDPVTGDVRMSMADTGIGIAFEDRERIFEKFFQVNSTSTRKYNGSGLGLALVKMYAGVQGFAVEVQSELGTGSTFTIIIPASLVLDA